MRTVQGVACLLCSICSIAWALLGSSSASAAAWAESGDAGDLLATAQIPVGPDPLDSISGTIFTSVDKDMYRIKITDPATFSATVIAGGSLTDTQLFLFDAGGFGVYGNDDPVAANPLSMLPASHPLGPMAAGTYYLAISGPDNDPTTGGVEIFDDVNPGVQSAAGPAIDGWTQTVSVFGGTYTIQLTGAGFANGKSVPPLGPWGLALLTVALGVQGSRRLQT